MATTTLTEEYNDEPVFYCTECLSLKIKDGDGVDYCDECGSASIEKTSIAEWEEMYKKKYERKFLKK